jgi:3-isopropylmalate/(R)-2-methylmalate dehydratase small subunit
MKHTSRIVGKAAPLLIENLDTDQIMPKQFLRGIDKSGLKEGLLYDLRFDPQGRPRSDFILNQQTYQDASIIVSGANFGCGSSREHAVWGMLQYGIRAVVAPSFGEIFYSNAMNNRLLLVTVPEEALAPLVADAMNTGAGSFDIDVETQRLRTASLDIPFDLIPRHRRMFLEGLDSIGLSLTFQDQISIFAERHWASQPWLRDVAARVRPQRI